MKILKKMNKGLILTSIVLIILIIYLVRIEITRNAQKPQIEELCKEYIALIDEYATMPKDSQKLYHSMELNETQRESIKENANNAITNNMEELEKKLKEKMIDNTTAIAMQKNTVKELVENNNDVFTSVTTKINKEITKIKKMAFDGDQVIVTFATHTEQEIKYLEQATVEESRELTKKDSFDRQEETITLQKVDGVWKIIYADLIYENHNFGSTRIMTETINF